MQASVVIIIVNIIVILIFIISLDFHGHIIGFDLREGKYKGVDLFLKLLVSFNNIALLDYCDLVISESAREVAITTALNTKSGCALSLETELLDNST
jgi:hypothetical protein